MRRALALALALAGCDDGGPGASVDARPPADATVDAAADAGLADAGGAGPADAGPADAGLADAGLADAPPAQRWAPGPAVGGGAIQEIAVVATGDAIWVLGGFDGQARIVNDVRIFEPSIGAWRAGPPLPVRLHHANAAVVDGRLYVLGYLVQGFAAEGRAFRLDPAVGTWEERAPLPPARTRGASGVAVIDGLIYLAGGLGGGRAVALVDRYDPAADTWEALPDLPTPRDHMAAGAVDGRLVIAGGRSADIESHVDRVDVFDPARGTWASGAPMPTSRGGTAAAVLDGWLYVIGGEGNRGAASGVFDAVEAWHGATDRWVRLPAMPHPRHGMAAATLDGRIYVPGGASRQAFGAVDTLEVLAP